MSLVLHLTGLLSLISHSLMSGILSNHVHLVNICILYLLFYKKKSNVFNYFKKFKTLIKKNDYSINSLRMDKR